MDLRILGYFVAVHDEGNLSSAARRCGVSQPSISAAMQTLEDQLGGQLFVRHSKGVTPTAIGGQLYPRAVKLLAEADAIRSIVRDDAPAETLKLALAPFMPFDRVALVLRELRGAGPGYDVSLVEAGAASDLRLATRQTLRDDEIFYPLWQDHFMLALPRAHLLTLKPQIGLAELDGLAWIGRKDCEVEAHFAHALTRAGASVKTKALVATDEQALALLGAGIGACLLPLSLQGAAHAARAPLPDLVLERNVGLAHARGFAMTDALMDAFNQCARVWRAN